MMERSSYKVFNGKTSFILLGEAGSGKTEISINLALYLSSLRTKPVHLFDMDQTKPMFRARDRESELARGGVTLHYQSQFLDAPTVAPGVARYASDADFYTLFDIGGGYYGTHMMGQFSSLFTNASAMVLYIVNPFRPWSRTRAEIDESMERTLRACGLKADAIIANPNIGQDTTRENILCGLDRIRDMLPEYKIELVTVMDRYADISSCVSTPVFPMALQSIAY